MYKENMDFTSRKKAFGKILRTCRTISGYSVSEVTEYLANNNIQNVSESALYSWEDGYSLPKAVTFLALCDLYHIDNVLTTFDVTNAKKQYPTSGITEREYNMIMKLRSKPEYHDAINKLLS